MLEEVEEESSEDSSSFSSGHEWPTAGSDCSGEEPAKVFSQISVEIRISIKECYICIGENTFISNEKS